MAAGADFAAVARAIAQPVRARILGALMSGTAWTVGELARASGAAPSSASEHIRQLERGGLVTLARQGRHTYVTLSGERAASALEALSLIAPPVAPPPSLRGRRDAEALAAGRTCYRHLAGELGVRLAGHLRGIGVVDDAWALTPAAGPWFADRGVVLGERRPSAATRACIDWTERRPHLAGAPMNRLVDEALAQGWIRRGAAPRAVTVSAEGERVFFGGSGHPAESRSSY